MYLTAGQYKGTKIDIPKSAKPTLSKVRESVFNILAQFDTKDNKFLDMFSGSAIMGLEALSRGYIVTEIEINPKTANLIKKNYEKIKVKPNITICDALKYKGEKFNIIYIDPPWNMDYIPIIKKAIELLNEKGILIIEHDKKIDFDLFNNSLELVKSKKYGRCLIDFLILL